MGRPTEFACMSVYTDSMLDKAYERYVTLLTKGIRPTSDEFVYMFGLARDQASALLHASAFKYEMCKKGAV